MDGRKTRGRTYRQRIIKVLSDYWELTLNQRSSVVDSLSNHIIRRVDVIQQFASGNLSIES